MKRILSAALACAVLLAGCAAPASTSGAPGGTSAVSAPEPTPAPHSFPGPQRGESGGMAGSHARQRSVFFPREH